VNSRKLRDERRVVHHGRRTGWQARRRHSLAHYRSRIRKHHVNRTSPFDVRTAAETIVLILLAPVRVRLGRLLSTAQLRHEQIGCCPGQKQANDRANDHVPAKGVQEASIR
jgi:hypothetical protein